MGALFPLDEHGPTTPLSSPVRNNPFSRTAASTLGSVRIGIPQELRDRQLAQIVPWFGGASGLAPYFEVVDAD